MQRKAMLSLAIALIMGCASTAYAQDDDLSGVTLRVLDDVSDIDAVVIAIDDERGDAAHDEGEAGDGEQHDGSADRDGDERDVDGNHDGDDGDGADRDDFDHDDVEDDDHLERGEGELEDHDVERDRVEEHTGDDVPGETVEP